MNYTREQKLAQSLDRHLNVTANAGSGKTRVLVDRYLKYLANGDNPVPNDPRTILAITFTKKAASEMTAKIVRQVNEMIASPDNKSPRTLRKLKRMRDSMTYARISTIHSFCSSILRQFPIEAGLNPNFFELDDISRKQMLDEIVNEIAEDLLLDDEGQNKELIIGLSRQFGYETLIGFASAYLSGKTLHGHFGRYYSRDNEALIEEVNGIFWGNFISDSIKVIHLVKKYSGRIKTDAKLSQKAENVFEAVLVQFESLMQRIESGEISHDCNIEELVNNLAEIFDTQIGRPKLPGLFKKVLGENHPDFIFMDKFKEELKSISAISSNLSLQEEYFRHAKMLHKFGSLAAKRMAEEMQSLGAVDFDDLLIKADEVLSKPEVAEKVRSEYSHILVDEFQDTDEIQYSILKKIIPELSGSTIKGPTLFIVGDAKQSIYAFRSADIRVFREACRNISTVNRGKTETGELNNNYSEFPEESLSDEESAGSVALKATFRLKPVIAAFSNRVFEPLMSSEMSDFDVDYEEFVVGRDSGDLLNEMSSENEVYNLDGNHGKVEFLISIEDKNAEKDGDEVNDEDESESATEAELVADKIASIISGSEGITVKGKNPKLGDIAILSRSKSKFGLLADALTARGIPYETHDGKGFYEAREVQDILAALYFLSDNSDNLSLPAALRSPVFGIDDTEIFNILNYPRPGDLFENLVKFAGDNPGSDIAKISEKISGYSELAGRLPVSSLIEHILTDSKYYEKTHLYRASRQMQANLSKLASIARDIEGKGKSTLYDFTREMEMRSADLDEAEARVPNTRDAVTMMSVHASKGLEFPIVFVYNTNSKSGMHGQFEFTKEFGFNFKYRKRNKNGTLEHIEFPVNKVISNQIRTADEAEQKRLFYVACTRAKDNLYISGNLSIKKDGNPATPKGFMKLLAESLFDGDLTNMPPDKLAIDTELPILSGALPVKRNIRFDINIKTKSGDEGKIENAGPAGENDILPIIHSFEHGYLNETYISASKIMTFENSVKNYREKYMLGLPDSGITDYSRYTGDIESDNDEISGSISGTYIHKALESITKWGVSGDVDTDSLENIFLDLAKSREENANENLRERIISECSDVAKSGFIRRNFELLKNAKFEHSLILPIEQGYMKAVFDVLLENKNGEPEIWDWKTNMVNSRENIEFLAQKYLKQMEVYLWFLYHLTPDCENYRAKLLFTNFAGKSTADEWIYEISYTRDKVEKIGEKISSSIKSITDYEIS
jgi:ATP-dependent helicase/nuclease subunit A